MLNKKILLFPTLLLTTVVFANTHKSSDWMPDNSFTQGVEGPAVDKNGHLFAVNYLKAGTIGKVTDKGQAKLYLTLPNGSIGNGIRFDQSGNMYIADYVNHNVLVYNSESEKLSVYAHNNKMNQPNDIAIMDSGILFASDPNWSENLGNLWRINIDGSTVLLEENMGTTNGVEVSPDNKTLYVNESVQRNIWRYQLDTNGNISNKQLFYKFEDHGMDGMRTDNQGNLYVARYGAGVIAIISPQGELINTVKLTGQHPTNVAFGGKDGKQVFVTMQKRGAIETFTNNIAGRNFH
ncbi:MAG: SMP-30/gluconolactonase/LRE family protein [Colwelliaceae bacterium]|nr:SMP-30/gluconolactonase/LRE family protein [Colwelliaceae bacterium]